MELPAHITVERFKRTAITAVQNNPDLLDGGKVDRASFFSLPIDQLWPVIVCQARGAATFSHPFARI